MTTIKEKAREYDDLNPCALPRVAYESGWQECARSVLGPLTEDEQDEIARALCEGIAGCSWDEEDDDDRDAWRAEVRAMYSALRKLRGVHG